MSYQLTKEFEGLRLNTYKDVAGLDTIYFGHLVKKGETYAGTIEEAEEYLIKDMELCKKALYKLVQVPLSDNQEISLLDFIYNLGIGAFRNSTLRMCLNRGEYQKAANELLRWNKARVNGVLVPVAGLTRRRIAERELFLS